MHSVSCKIYIISLLVVVSVFYSSALIAQTYGLKFQGQDVTLDKRTELNLSPYKFLKFKDEVEISFDYKIDLVNRNSLFGYVLRVINQKHINIDLISTPEPDIPLNLVIGKNNSIVPIENFENAINHWINLRLKIILSEDRMIFYTPDTFYVQENVGFKKHDAFKIIFGANDYEQFKTTDVPSMNIKNVKLFEKGKLKFHWPLDIEEGNIAIDRINEIEASVKNPSWLRNNHQVWQSRLTEEIRGNLMVASDGENDRIFLIGNEKLIIYSARDNNSRKIEYANKPDFITSSYSAIYNSTDGKIYCYLPEESPFYTLNIETGEWNETGSISEYETEYKHHNQYYNAADNSIYLFGGYGHHSYKNSIRKIDITENTIVDLSTNDSIFKPRYLAGLGALDDTVYIFGGYGSESGNQLINPQSYYDLFGYSLNDGTLFRKFEIPRIIDNMLVANSMWIDPQTRNYFSLVFEKTIFDGHLHLLKGSLDSPEIAMLGSNIPFKFLDVRSYASLFYMPKQRQLFAYTSYTTESTTTQAALYSISYPPNLFIETSITQKKSKGSLLLYITVALLLIILPIIWFLIKRKRKKIINEEHTEEKKESVRSNYIEEKEEIIENPDYQLIYFGGFQVFNKDFVDITSKFSPLLKELYLLILLHTFKNDKGISSDKITEILWYDKSEKSARNNRAVNIAKLRAIMSEIGACELTKKTGYWKINPDNRNIKSDYIDFLELTASKTNLTKQKIERLINITKKGAFLLNVHYDWMDEFKASVSDTIIDTLVKYAETCDINKDAEFIIDLADSIFNFELINEEAMIMKCKAQYHLGKHSHAKATYQKYYKEYVSMYSQEYEKSFLQILEMNV